MKRFRQILPLAVVALGLFAMAGCGGGGGGTSGNSSTMGVYVTDGFGDQYSQVWVTIYKIEASVDGTTYTTVYDDPAGKTVNLSRLANSAEFLGAVSLPQTNYTKVRVVIGDHVTLVPRAGGAGQSVPVDDSFPIADGKATITFNVANPGSHHDLVVDFDLAAFELVSGKVRPHVKHGDDDAIHHEERHAEAEGIVENLTSAGFDLRHGNMVFHVQTTADTTVTSERTGAAATLANGQRVHVRGGVNADTHTVVATEVLIQDVDHHGDDHDHEGAEAEGTVASIDAVNKSFVLTLEEAEDFHPTSGAVTVVTDGSTVFEKRHHVAASFADLVVSGKVEVSGTYDDATNTLTAKRVEIK